MPSSSSFLFSFKRFCHPHHQMATFPASPVWALACAIHIWWQLLTVSFLLSVGLLLKCFWGFPDALLYTLALATSVVDTVVCCWVSLPLSVLKLLFLLSFFLSTPCFCASEPPAAFFLQYPLLVALGSTFVSSWLLVCAVYGCAHLSSMCVPVVASSFVPAWKPSSLLNAGRQHHRKSSFKFVCSCSLFSQKVS